jgi:hypothetical protein
MMVRDEYMNGTVAKVCTVSASMAKHLIQSFRGAVIRTERKLHSIC